MPFLALADGVLPNVPDSEYTISARLKNILAFGTVIKASFVVKDMVAKHREIREAEGKMSEEEKKEEDVLLDFMVWLAEKRERAALFKVVS
jgi:hypothetical protein